MAQQTFTSVQENFYQSAGSACIAAGTTAVIGFLCFMLFGAGIEATMQWMVALCLMSGGATFVGVSIGASAASRRERGARVPG